MFNSVQRLFTNLILFSLVAAFAFSCEKEPMLVEDTPAALSTTTIGDVAVSVEGGILHFATIKDLGSVLETPGIVTKGISVDGSFRSAAQAYREFISDENNDLSSVEANPNLVTIVEMEGERYLEPTVADDALSYLTNANGVVNAGSKMIKVGHEDFRFVSVADYAEMGMAAFNSALSLKVEPIKTVVSNRSKRNVIPPVRDEFTGEGSRSARRRDYRLTGNLESTESLIGPNRVIVRSKLFKKRFGIWWGTSGNLTNEYNLQGEYSLESFSYNRVDGPISRNAQNFPLEVVSTSEFSSGNRNGVFSVFSGGFFRASGTTNGGRGDITMLP